MSNIQKALEHIVAKPKDMRWPEARNLLESLGYKQLKSGKSGGSRRKFCIEGRPETLINLHEPHKPNILKEYQVKIIIEALTRDGFIDEG